jgi:uncharacterized protein with GYD domain
VAKYLIEATYSAEGLKGLEKDKPSGRQAVVTKAVKGLGGKVEAFYYSLGDHDVVVIIDLPDLVSATALAMHVSDSGLVRTKTTALLSVEDADRAVQMKVDYRAPGR